MRLLARLGPIRLAVILIIVLAAIAGAIFSNSLSGSAGALQVGDCFDEPSGTTVSDVQHRPCNEPHTGEVFALVDYPNPPATWPELATMKATANSECLGSRFTQYTGRDATNVSDLNFGYFYPAEANWDHDKQLICYLGPANGQPVAGSYAAANAEPPAS